jgi:hypothetical protein
MIQHHWWYWEQQPLQTLQQHLNLPALLLLPLSKQISKVTY